MSLARAIDVWCNKAKSLEKRLSLAADDYEYLANSYPDMRDKSASLNKAKYNAAKERIDDVFGKVTQTRRYFCQLKAGGGRKRGTRRNK
jgi:hypothetical protein